MKKSFAEILQETDGTRTKKMLAKVPSWAGGCRLEFPNDINVEQCSSEATAEYKARLAARISPGGSIADLTGGLGVDSWAFSRRMKEILYNEMDRALEEAVMRNYAALGVGNATFRNSKVEPGQIEAILGEFSPDIIFLDPARRSDCGRKVFMPEDCQPDFLKLLPEMLQVCDNILVKLSPMADIHLLSSKVGEELAEVHIVGAGGECKELLLHIQKGHSGPYRLIVAQDKASIELPWKDTADAELVCEAPSKGMVLFEPSKALLKSGAFNYISEKFGLKKIGRSAHLYVGNPPAELSRFGKRFEISESLEFNNANLKALAKRYPDAEITARNLPIATDALRKKMGISQGGDAHIFAVNSDFRGKLLLVTYPLQAHQ